MDAKKPNPSDPERDAIDEQNQGLADEKDKRAEEATIPGLKQSATAPGLTPRQRRAAEKALAKAEEKVRDLERSARGHFFDAAYKYANAGHERLMEAHVAEHYARIGGENEDRERKYEEAGFLYELAGQDYRLAVLNLTRSRVAGRGSDIATFKAGARDAHLQAAGDFLNAATINMADGEPGEAAELFSKASEEIVHAR